MPVALAAPNQLQHRSVSAIAAGTITAFAPLPNLALSQPGPEDARPCGQAFKCDWASLALSRVGSLGQGLLILVVRPIQPQAPELVKVGNPPLQKGERKAPFLKGVGRISEGRQLALGVTQLLIIERPYPMSRKGVPVTPIPTFPSKGEGEISPENSGFSSSTWLSQGHAKP